MYVGGNKTLSVYYVQVEPTLHTYTGSKIRTYRCKLHSDMFRWRKPTPRTKQHCNFKLSLLSSIHTFISPPLQHRARSCHASHVQVQSQLIATVSLVTYLISPSFQTPHFKVNIHTFIVQHTKAVIFITHSSMKFLFLVQNYINNYRLTFKTPIIYRQTQK